MRRALLSVSDKADLVPFASALQALGFELLSTGGTAKALTEAGLNVTDVASYTGSPEVMDGRVKTLHPRVHGGLLARDTDSDRADLDRLGGHRIDLVVVNLYPFESAVAQGCSRDVAIENIDIGGPSMLRSAAKNHARVTVVVDPSDYDRVLESLSKPADESLSLRAELARKVFAHTSAYDAAIANYLSDSPFPADVSLTYRKVYDLRYGENPHQRASFYRAKDAGIGTLACARSLGTGAKELSYNNFLDADAALACVREFRKPTAVVVKHTNPCGVASAEAIEEAYVRAREADALSAFGGIVAVNRPVTLALARQLAETFLECIVAPTFDEDALELLRKKNALRLLELGVIPSPASAILHKRIDGGLLLQDSDLLTQDEVALATVVTERIPTESELRGLEFAWSVCKHVKSNAIVLAREEESVGIGAGQMSRVLSVEIAVKKAAEKARGSVLASDAFFPFADGVLAAAAAGVTAIVQPGGSKKDEEVIAACNANNIAMLVTGRRHFHHG